MKLIKKIFYFIVALLIAGCIGILVCAMNPELTQKLANLVQQVQSGQGIFQKPEDIIVNSNAGFEEDGLTGVPDNTRQPVSYVVPEILPVTLPEGLEGLAGYIPMDEVSEEIAQDEAENLGNILTEGETGEGLELPSEFYPYYGMLDSTLQKLYRQICANATELNTSFVPVVSVSVSQVKRTMEAVYNDHPELFWLESGYGCKYLSTGICVELSLKYNATANQLDQAKKDFEACANEILEGARTLPDIYSKETYIHDALVKIVAYDENADMNQSAYSALVRGKTVCAGYARAFQYLMQQLDIPCYYCTGFAGENHAWDIVKLDNLYRNVDVTWDDTNPSTYDYFNKSDLEYASTHVRTDLAVYLPACVHISAPSETESDNIDNIDSFINPEPQEPLSWQSRGETIEEDEEDEESEEDRKEAEERENLLKAGLKEEQVMRTLEDYYKDCEAQLKKIGAGQNQFINYIPASLWETLEKEYATGNHEKGYVESILKELKAENFLIQLQVQRLNGGFYKLYHNVSIY